MNEKINELTKAYYDGTASKKELEELNYLIADSVSSRKAFSSRLSELESVRPMDIAEQRAFSKVVSNLNDRKTFSPFLRKAAAVLIPVAASLALAAILWPRPHSSVPEYTEFYASGESSCAVTLPDSSSIVLFSGARLLKPSDFSASNRRVTLSGEACFDIRSDSQHPFVIDAGNDCSVTVRGTKFDLSAPSDGENVRLTLLRGSVEFNTPDMSIIMSPGESLLYSAVSGDSELSHVDVESYEAWLSGELEFHNLPFDELVGKICSLYGRKVVLDNALKNKRGLYSIRLINRETLDEVISALDVMTPLKARYDTSCIYLSTSK